MKILLIVGGVSFLLVALFFFSIRSPIEAELSENIPVDPSEEFRDNLEVGEYSYHEESEMYYTVLEDGSLIGTGGAEAERNIQIEIESRK